MTAKEKLDKALEALKWYADQNNYNLNTWPGKPIEKDVGKLAKKTLGEIWRGTRIKKAVSMRGSDTKTQ